MSVTARAGLLLAGLATFTLGWLFTKRRHGVHDALPTYKLVNRLGMQVWISPVGAAITRVIVKDAKGRKADVVLGYATAQDYITTEPVTYFGVVVGRVANRIANAKFTLPDGTQHTLLANNGPNALHGGAQGLHKRVWDAMPQDTPEYSAVTLRYDSPDGEEGYPGNVHVMVTYRLARDRNEITCEIRATTDTVTPLNIVQHSYWNLAGHASGTTILDHELHLLNADHYTPLGDHQIPTGEVAPVMGTPFDFCSTPHAIGERIDQVPGGYDHNFVLFNQGPQARFITNQGVASLRPKLAASLRDPKSGRALDILTTAPGVQLYSGNFLDGSAPGKNGVRYGKYAGLCLETQAFPNAVNQPDFPSVFIKPTETYKHTIVYRFYNK